MKKLITTCVLLTSVSVMSFAQSATAKAGATTSKSVSATPEQIATKNAQMYKQQYNLNDEQYKNVYRAELDYAKADAQPHGEGTASQMKLQRDQRMQNTLKPDQYANYKASTGGSSSK